MATRSGRVGLQNNKSNAKATPLSQPVADKAVTPKTPKEAPVVKLVETVDDNVEDPEPCNGCKAVITESECDKTIKCDQCQKWYHLKCSSLNTRALTFLKTADDLPSSSCYTLALSGFVTIALTQHLLVLKLVMTVMHSRMQKLID